jgi:hypothetical protein
MNLKFSTRYQQVINISMFVSPASILVLRANGIPAFVRLLFAGIYLLFAKTFALR